MPDAGGVPFQIVSEAEAEQVEFVVCCRVGVPSRFDDNVEAVCCDCGHGVFHRPRAPKRPPKICMECMLDRVEGGRA